jgi:AcrR family transcriptional regulator
MRADARKNYEQLLAVAHVVVAEDGADASLRDIARRAGVGLGTLYRHFPTREALLEALLRTSFDRLKARAQELEAAEPVEDALLSWLRDFATDACTYHGIAALMMAAIEDEESALHASCVTMRAAGTRLLERAQEAGAARADMDGTDLFALAGAMAWLGDQPSLARRIDRLFDMITGSILTTGAGRDAPAHGRPNGRGSDSAEPPPGQAPV